MDTLNLCLTIIAAGGALLGAIALLNLVVPAIFNLFAPTPFRPFALEAEALRRQQHLVAEMRDILTITEDALQHCSTRIKEVDRSISLQERKERVARRRPLQRRLGRL